MTDRLILADTAELSPEGFAALTHEEGIVPTVYRDSVGVLTWGIGHTAGAGEPIPAQMSMAMPANVDVEVTAVLAVFMSDLEKFQWRVRRALAGMTIAQSQFDAAFSFDFNAGAIHTATWVKSWKRGALDRVPAEIMNWRKPAEIIDRRKGERDMWTKGIYPGKPTAVWGTNGRGKVDYSKVLRVISADDMADMFRALKGAGPVEPIPAPVPAPAVPLPAVILRQSARGKDVRTLQEALNRKGFNAGAVDGIFGRATTAAVRAFQRANGLTADGVVGPKTWAKLLGN